MKKINDKIKHIVSNHYSFDSLFKRDYKYIKKLFNEILENEYLKNINSLYISCDERSTKEGTLTLTISINPPEYRYTPFSEHKSGWFYDSVYFSIDVDMSNVEEFYFFGNNGDYIHYNWKVILN